MTFLEQILEKTIDDTNISFKERYPLREYDFFIIGPGICRNDESLYPGEYGPDLAEKDFKIDEDKELISYTDRHSNQRLTEKYSMVFSAWVNTSDIRMSKATVYVCKKFNKVKQALSAFSTQELLEELIKRYTNEKVKTN